MEKWRRPLSREFGASDSQPGVPGSQAAVTSNYLSSYSASGCTKLVEQPSKCFLLEGFRSVHLGMPSVGREKTRPQSTPWLLGLFGLLPTSETQPKARYLILPPVMLSLAVRKAPEPRPLFTYRWPLPGRELHGLPLGLSPQTRSQPVVPSPHPCECPGLRWPPGPSPTRGGQQPFPQRNGVPILHTRTIH